MNPLTGELYHHSVKNTPSLSRESWSPIKSSSKYVLSGLSLKSMLQPEGTIQFATEQDRFNTDFAAEERDRRNAVYQRRRALQDQNRSLMEQRSFERSVSIEAIERQQAERYRFRAVNILEKNKSDYRSAFNPITHDYDPTSKGKILETHDRLKEIRADRRKANINAKGNSSFNIINGFDRRVYY
mmetsp:Transcript_378/g.446  ORF Transcript_378/g.446 Transcript_378/m.446 type:complete len:185 (+) Transcript_378:148-702(+)